MNYLEFLNIGAGNLREHWTAATDKALFMKTARILFRNRALKLEGHVQPVGFCVHVELGVKFR